MAPVNDRWPGLFFFLEMTQINVSLLTKQGKYGTFQVDRE